MKRFERQSVLVTGGSSGIGYAAAKAFVAEGARVVITGRDEAALVKAAAELGAIAIRNEVGAVGAAKALASELTARDIRLDAVFANAGIARFSPFADSEEALWDETFNINVKGVYFQLQALLPLLNNGASIVLNGSIVARLGMPNSSIYSASKAALISLARTLSTELIERRIRVNVVSPGPISTPILSKMGMDAATLDATAASIRGQVPIRRFGEPQEIAATVLHLAATESAFIVGTEIAIDGGMGKLQV